ncbi:MAG: hypothetical protein J6T59_05140 [Bacteroidales bacterium]|nr:hypothetical protein [Bacteroidales bacterium]MBO7647569.1 hypothetical protein [Bacteroidales bacterium]
MKKRNPIYLIGIILGLFLISISAPSCTTTQRGTKKAVKYSRQRTKQAHWNTTTSRTTTYYIKKHSTKNRKAPKKPNKHK